MNKRSETKVVTLDELLADWDEYSNSSNIDANVCLSYGIKALEFGHFSIAYNILRQGLIQHPDHTDLQYRAALALARGGSITTATVILEKLLNTLNDKDPLYPDVLSLAGRVAKDCWSKAEDDERRKKFAGISTDYYQQAFTLTDDYYPGINAATMSLVANHDEQAQTIAAQVYELCQLARENVHDDYWLTATIGEACLLLEQYDEARNWYEQTRALAKNRYGDIASIRRQVRYLSEYRQHCESILDVLHIPVVIAFTGHMLDANDRVTPRFPTNIEKEVAAEIKKYLARFNSVIAYSSAASGSDILFLEAVQERKGETHVTLPFNKAEFIDTSVAYAGDKWLDRFEHVIEHATSVNYATREGYLGDNVLYSYANDLISGNTILRADALESEAILLSVIDPSQQGQEGGSLENTELWKSLNRNIHIIDLNSLRKNNPAKTTKQKADNHSDPESQLEPDNKRQLMTMLFADVVGFSKLGEEEAPSFFVNFLGRVSELINNNKQQPVFCNTWGDGLFMVFDDIAVAAEFALRLRDMVTETDWQSLGLPKETNIRIGMHAGPVYGAFDPIIEQANYFGSHVNRAARIEPVTTPGAVFVSEQTACLLAISSSKRFACDYLGIVDLAKKYGQGALYRLRRENQSE